MIQPIIIDMSAFAEVFDISQDEIKSFADNIVGELATEFAMAWNKEADVLKSSRQEYKNSIYVQKISDSNYVVGLNGWLPNAVEQGTEGFDEKMGFKSSSKTTKTKDGGWYLTIPFRHATPGAIGESEAFSGTLPSKVYSQAKNLTEGSSLNVKNLPAEFQAKKTREKVVTKSKIFEEYQNKHSVYSGLQKKHDLSGRGQYVTFRRVSDKSDPDSWINGGIEEHGFAEKALNKMDIAATVDLLANKYIEQL